MTVLAPAVAVALLALGAGDGQVPAAPSAADVAAAIDQLGSLDSYETRMNAARTVRRAEADLAVPALTRAVRSHADEYVRYRALVLLAGFARPTTADLMRELMADRNDRIRTVVFGWYEHHPDPAVVPRLVEALATERSEFVRPALTRALAAHGDDPRAQAVLVPLVLRGEDFFRGAVIEALGEYRGAYALEPIVSVAELQGPLQDDAITAIGRIGDRSQRATLARLQRSAPRELQPTLSASLCLLGFDCETHRRFIDDTLAYAAATEGVQPLLRGAVHAEGMLAARGRTAALDALFDRGVSGPEAVRAPIALGVGLIAFRNPRVLLDVLASRSDRAAAVELVRDAFDMLNEDFEEERFFVEVRRAYWAAAAGSAARDTAELLITMLEL